MEEEAGEPAERKAREAEEEVETSLFPLFPLSDASLLNTSKDPQWLCNTSFTTDLSVVHEAVSSRYNLTLERKEEEEEEEDGADEIPQAKPPPSYDLLDSSASEQDNDSKREKKKEKKKKRKRNRSREPAADDYASRKSGVRAWDGSDTKPAKDYYFDSSGDRDNLAFGSLYRMDVARYKLHNSSKFSGSHFQGLYRWKYWDSVLDGDGDIDALDSKLRSGGRYWSTKYSALERHKDFKRVRIFALDKSLIVPGEYIPLPGLQTSSASDDGRSPAKTSAIEESWEDEVFRKTKEFNKLSRDAPHDEKVWIAFAEFQDKVASRQPQKGARLQTLEKKISILEKATELNPDSEELLLCLLKAYQSRDSMEVLVQRWEKILMQHSGNCKLWKEFLRVVGGDFSRFKVSDMRRMYTHAIQALSATCSKLCRQLHQSTEPLSIDPAIVQLELGMVDIFVSLCRFEWQAGYQELATALFQAQIEYSLFCPSLLLTEQSKQRLFEHFWNSDGARLGEEEALGWSTWLEKEEENRQKLVAEDSSQENEEGGWTGWLEPLSRNIEISKSSEDLVDDTMGVEEVEEDFDAGDQEDDVEALLKKLGIDVDAGAESEVKDTATWTRWSEEESSRDCGQWMPVHEKYGTSRTNDTLDREGEEQLLGVILFEDINEYLFSLCSEEARFSLICQFIDFFGGKISQWACTNSSSWIENSVSLEALPDSILEDLRKVQEVVSKVDSSSSNFNLEFLLGSSNDISRRTSMMKFLRNAILLCLTVFPRNHIMEEAALVAEELFTTRMNSCPCSVTPSRALAKSLLKNDRQDLLLCGVYARSEAAAGNIDLARKVFDMALSSIEGLQSDLRSNAPLLYFWYAEVELANCPGHSSESSSVRAIHILSCLGSGVKYSPFKCQPSSLQLLRAHQGFKERIRTLRSAWARGDIKDHSIALICSASLFADLTAGWANGLGVLDEAFLMVLPERRSQSSQLESLFNYYIRMLQKHHKQLKPSRVWDSILQGLQIYPYNPKLFAAFIEISHLYTVPNKLRWIFDEYCHKKPSVIVWLFALSFEMGRRGSQHRIHGLFERAKRRPSSHFFCSPDARFA